MRGGALEEICNLLDTYKGRDKVLRTLCYAAKLIGALPISGQSSHVFVKFSKQMSITRATLRLFDDLPMLRYTLDYGLGGGEGDRLSAALGVACNVVDQLFYPIEKVCWLAEHRMLDPDRINVDRWDTLSSICWAVSIYLTLMKSLRYISMMERAKGCVPNSENVTTEILKSRQYYEALTCVRLSLDFVHAVSTLPKGFLWSSKLNTWQVSVVATVSSALGLYQIFAKRNVK